MAETAAWVPPYELILSKSRIQDVPVSQRQRDSESKAVEWLVREIEANRLLGLIEGKDEIAAVTQTFEQPHFIPAFTVDYLSRRSSAAAAAHALSNLESLEIIAVNKSISLTSGEVLRPDILCFNSRTNTLVIFEVKRALDTERQAITELAGYEQELRNIFPFLGAQHICQIVVATDWSTLLEHSVGCMNAWSNKIILALNIDLSSSPYRIACLLPDAWHARGSFGLPPSAITSQITLLNPVEQEEHDGCIPPLLITACQSIARDSDRRDAHGFLVIWRRGESDGPSWAVSVSNVDPIAMYAWCRDHGIPGRASEVTEYFDRRDSARVADAVNFSAHRRLLLLDNNFCIAAEDSRCWDECFRALSSAYVPLYFEFWGQLGDYSRDFICNPAVRHQYMPYIAAGDLDWTEPVVAYPLLNSVLGRTPFPRGVIRCGDLFGAGLALHTLEWVTKCADASEEAERALGPFLKWAELSALCYAIEMKQIYDSSSEISEPIPAISNKRDRRLGGIRALIQWVHVHLIGDQDPVHRACFDLGGKSVLAYCEWNATPEQLSVEEIATLANSIRSVTRYILRRESLYDVSPLRTALVRLACRNGDDEELLSSIPDEKLMDSFQEHLLIAFDLTVPPVHYTTIACAPLFIDWEHIKSCIATLFAAGERWPAVLTSADGMIGSGMVARHLTHCLAPISDPLSEVYFVDERPASSITVKKTWDEIRSLFAHEKK